MGEKERRLVGRRKHLHAFMSRLREKAEGKNQKLRTKHGLDQGLLRREDKSQNFYIKIRAWCEKAHLKGVITAGSGGVGWDGTRSNPG